MSTDASLFDALISGNARRVMDELFPQGQQQPMPGNPALVERPSPCDDAGTAGVVDFDYDGAPYCSHCGAKKARWCTCGPIASNE